MPLTHYTLARKSTIIPSQLGEEFKKPDERRLLTVQGSCKEMRIEKARCLSRKFRSWDVLD